MEKNLIKKELYKQKPIAEFSYEVKGFKNYSCEITVDGAEEIVTFSIPLEECAETLEDQVEAHLLIRWLD